MFVPSSPPRCYDSYALQALMPLPQRPPAVFVRGQGSWLWDSEGRRHLDLVQGWAVNTLGHAAPSVAAALARQAGTLLQPGPGLYNDQALLLAERLAALSGLDQVFFTSSGADANETAIKLARKHGQHRRGGAGTVLSFGGSFHGRTLATMAASGKPGFDRIHAPALPGFIKSPYNDLAAARSAIGPDTAAVMLELVQGEAGVVEADLAFVQGLRALCDANGLLLIVDEVQTGIARCGTLFAFEQYGIRPDIVTLGKGLGGGVPVGATLARRDAVAVAPGDLGGTFNGNPLVCAVALAVLDAVTAPGFLPAVHARGAQLDAGLAALSRRHRLRGTAGRGLLRALLLPSELPAGVLAETARCGEPALLVNAAQPQRLRLMPALNIADDEVEQALALLDRALARCTAAAAA